MSNSASSSDPQPSQPSGTRPQRKRRPNQAESPVFLHTLSPHGLDLEKTQQKHGEPASVKLVVERTPLNRSHSKSKSNSKSKQSKSKSKQSSEDEDETQYANEYYFEIEYKDSNSEFYTWWDGLYEFGSFCFDVVMDCDDHELQEMVLCCYQKQKWELHSHKSLVIFADPNNYQKEHPIAMVESTRHLSQCYSFEVEHIKNEYIRYIDISVMKSDSLVFVDIGENQTGQWMSGYDLSVVDVSGVDEKGLQTLAAAIGNSIRADHLSAQLLLHSDAFKDVLEQLMTIVLKDLRRKMRFRETAHVVTGGSSFAEPLWEELRAKTEEAEMETTGIEDENRGYGQIYASIDQWHKLYDEDVFEKIKSMNGTDHNITVDYIDFKFYYKRKYLEYESRVVVD